MNKILQSAASKLSVKLQHGHSTSDIDLQNPDMRAWLHIYTFGIICIAKEEKNNLYFSILLSSYEYIIR